MPDKTLGGPGQAKSRFSGRLNGNGGPPKCILGLRPALVPSSTRYTPKKSTATADPLQPLNGPRLCGHKTGQTLGLQGCGSGRLSS